MLKLVSPMKRAGSSVPQFVKRIPTDIKDRLVGRRLIVPLGDKTVSIAIGEKTTSIRFSLQTRDESKAKIHQAEALAYLETVFQSVRNDVPVSLTHKQATALAGELYRGWADDARTTTIAMIHTPEHGFVLDDEYRPGEQEEIFSAALAHFGKINASGEPEDLEKPLGAVVDRLLQKFGIASVEKATRNLLLYTFWKALKDAMENRKRQASGDYSPDSKADRFPELQLGEIAKIAEDKVSLLELVERWWKEAEAGGGKPSTYESYRNTMRKFTAFLGCDDARRVTAKDVIGFKDFRLSSVNARTGKPISARTVKDADLAGLKSVFGWAVNNMLLPSNPAKGITIKLGKQLRVRSKGFTDEEIKALLNASLMLKHGRERADTYAAKHWIPWLLAYTGARVGEIAQLRKEDVKQKADHWSITITPEAGTVKSNSAREVPLHPHLVELGFPEFVGARSNGHLFLKPAKNGDVLGPLKGVKNRVREFVREHVTDPNVQPNHAWRHLFVTNSRAVGMDQEIRRMITGHSGQGVDERNYGDPAGLYREICKLPKFMVE